MPEQSPLLNIQSVFAEISASTTTTSAVFVDLISQAITTSPESFLEIQISASSSNTNATREMDFQLVIDGVAARGFTNRSPAANIADTGGLVYKKTGLATGSHTIKVQWRTTANTARVDPAGTVVEHCSLLIKELA